MVIGMMIPTERNMATNIEQLYIRDNNLDFGISLNIKSPGEPVMEIKIKLKGTSLSTPARPSFLSLFDYLLPYFKQTVEC
jgi:hypothetical protein